MPAPELPVPRILAVLGPVLAVLAGSLLAVQSRINGVLGTSLGDPVTAAFTAVVVGLVVVSAAGVLTRRGRNGARRLVDGLRDGGLRWWFLLAGLVGAVFVFAQTRTVETLGVSVLLLAVVVGQSVGGLAVDRWGVGPGGVRLVTGRRVLGTVLVVGAVLVAVSPRLSGAGQGLSVLVLLPLAAGTLMPLQTALNGRIGSAAGTPITPTLTNFLVAAAGLGAVTAVHRAAADPPAWSWAGPWWQWTGGPLGVLAVGAGALLARWIGVLQTSLGVVTGMLVGGLAVDVLMPSPGTVVAPLTVLGTALTLVGLVVTSWPGRAGPGPVGVPGRN
ncbi:DMT family transporter [Kocuria sp. M1R5S2]|uniref:DMT family transporter n=1 Tax=Kocuria rhizosphaerae TaxID=3376285 RepID=UPI0037A9C41C